MSTKHSDLEGADLHSQVVDVNGIVKIDVGTAGDDVVLRFLESDNKKIKYNATTHEFEFYMNSSNVGIKIKDHSIVYTPGTAPTEPVEGEVFYNESTNKLNMYNGSSWEVITSS